MPQRPYVAFEFQVSTPTGAVAHVVMDGSAAEGVGVSISIFGSRNKITGGFFSAIFDHQSAVDLLNSGRAVVARNDDRAWVEAVDAYSGHRILIRMSDQDEDLPGLVSFGFFPFGSFSDVSGVKVGFTPPTFGEFLTKWEELITYIQSLPNPEAAWAAGATAGLA